MLAQLQRWHWLPSSEHYLFSHFLSKWSALWLQSKLRTLRGNTEFMMIGYEPDQLSVLVPHSCSRLQGTREVCLRPGGEIVGQSNLPSCSSCLSQCQGLCAKKYLVLWECLECCNFWSTYLSDCRFSRSYWAYIKIFQSETSNQ